MLDSHKPHLILGTFIAVGFLESVKYFLYSKIDGTPALFTIFSNGLFLLMGMRRRVLVESTHMSLLCMNSCMGADVWHQLIILNNLSLIILNTFAHVT